MREGGDLVVRSQLARVTQAVEMLSTELEGLIDVIAAASERKGRRR